MSERPFKAEEIAGLYARFDAPIANLDCGAKCSPYNVGGKPFCCDICHAVPTGYLPEWEYLQPKTNLWHVWQAEQCVDSEEERLEEVARLEDETPDNMILLECLGPQACERDYRALTCRQFPFFPYVTSDFQFIGLSYYWDYEDYCWVISNLDVVTDAYRAQFVATFDEIFARMPEELETYQYHSEVMRDVYNERHQAIPLLHRNGSNYKISTHNERMRKVELETMPKFGPYKLAAKMKFDDE